MAIYHEQETQGERGHQKQIDESGTAMVFDLLQKFQYSFPIKSTTREILSNGVDSIAEKKVAIEILTGKAKVEDYFVELQGDLYKDSRFDPDYYDLDWLSPVNKVYMTYICGTSMDRDRVVFEDHGVGLGGKRLEKYFSLGYSTKRLSKLPLGKFGLGAKSPLSVGVDFYTVESRYNGKLFRFNVYTRKVDSIIPPINTDTGLANPHVIFGEGTPDAYKVHYLPTTDKNGLMITIEAKKHHRQQYIDAVRSQMLYFDGIDLRIKHPEGNTEQVQYRASVLYEDDVIVMSDNSYYSKPHLLLNKVNYGYVNFDELELEDKSGNIGIKVAPEDIDVNPSRESIIWSEKTKQKVLDRFNQVVDIAAGMIQKELDTTDFLRWIMTCHTIHGRYAERHDIVGRLSRIVDLSRAKFCFGPNPDIIFYPSVSFPGCFMREVLVVEEKEYGRAMKRKVVRTEIASIAGRIGLPIYLMKRGERASNLRDKYLFSLHPQGFITIMQPYDTIEQAENDGLSEPELKKLYSDGARTRTVRWELLERSAANPYNKGHIAVYGQVEVPAGFTGTEEEIEEVVPQETTEQERQLIERNRTTEAERRKQKGTTLVHAMMNPTGSYRDGATNRILLHTWEKIEVPIADIGTWRQLAGEIYYGHEADSSLLSFVALLTRDSHPGNKPGTALRWHATDLRRWVGMKWYRCNKELLQRYSVPPYKAYQMQSFFDTKVMLLKVSQTSARYYRDFKRVEEFFIQIHDKTITMSNQLIKWNTARIVKEKLGQAAFLYNFPFNPSFAALYKDLCAYVNRNFRETAAYANGSFFGLDEQTYQDMIRHLDKVQQFQQFVAGRKDDDNPDEVADMASVLFGNPSLEDGMAVEPVVIEQLDKLMEFVQACGAMLNFMPVLTGYSAVLPLAYQPGEGRSSPAAIPEVIEQEIRSYLEFRGVLDFSTTLPTEDGPDTLTDAPDSEMLSMGTAAVFHGTTL
jgi:hypothetical protein